MTRQTVKYKDFKNKYEGKYEVVKNSYNQINKTIDIVVDDSFYQTRPAMNTQYSLNPFTFIVKNGEEFEAVSFRAKALKNATTRCKKFCKEMGLSYVGLKEDNKEIEVKSDYWAYGIY